MSYGLLQLSDSTEARAKGGLKQAAQFEQHRNNTNERLDAAEDGQKMTLATTAGTIGAEHGLKAYWDAQNAAAVTEGTVAAGETAATSSEILAALEGGAATAETAATTAEIASALEAGTAATTSAAASTGAATTGAVATGTTAATGAAATGATALSTAAPTAAAMGPAGWMALAGIAAMALL